MIAYYKLDFIKCAYHTNKAVVAYNNLTLLPVIQNNRSTSIYFYSQNKEKLSRDFCGHDH